jgi:hypothetical protein
VTPAGERPTQRAKSLHASFAPTSPRAGDRRRVSERLSGRHATSVARIATSADTGVVPGNVLRTFVPKLLKEGYRLSTHSETKLVLEESHRLVWNHLLSVSASTHRAALQGGVAGVIHSGRAATARGCN